MKIFKLNMLIDIICDICQETCNKMNDKEPDYEYLGVYGTFGYNSDHDGEKWSAHICEKCMVKHLEKIICFDKREYHLMSPSEEYPRDLELNKRGDRIRKIRKLTGELGFEIINK